MNVLELDGVTRRFGNRTILKDVDLSLAAGQTVALMGANGSGKTTLLRIAATVLRPSEGTVRVGGESGAAARTHLAFVAHDAPVYRELTPTDHIRLALDLHKKPATPQAVALVLADAGLAKQSHRPCSVLSRGQRQRLALCTALAVEPRLLLLDEPYTGLDDAGRDWFARKLLAFPGTVLAALHEAPGAEWTQTVRIEGGSVA